MFLSLLTLSLILQFIQYTIALPAGPPGSNADGAIVLPVLDTTNLSSTLTPIILPGRPLGGRRPGDNHIWPEVTAAHYYIKFSHYGDDLPQKEGKDLLYVQLL